MGRRNRDPHKERRPLYGKKEEKGRAKKYQSKKLQEVVQWGSQLPDIEAKALGVDGTTRVW